MKLSLAAYLAIALAIALVGDVVLLMKLGAAKPQCKADMAIATVHADQGVRKDEDKRDVKLDAVSIDTKADAHAAVATVEKQTNERAQTIDRVPVTGDCRAPVGLPRLDAAVDQANAAAGN